MNNKEFDPKAKQEASAQNVPEPFDFDILTSDRFLQRKLRQVAKWSDVIGVNFDL
jgi:hypothetical protein